MPLVTVVRFGIFAMVRVLTNHSCLLKSGYQFICQTLRMADTLPFHFEGYSGCVFRKWMGTVRGDTNPGGGGNVTPKKTKRNIPG